MCHEARRGQFHTKEISGYRPQDALLNQFTSWFSSRAKAIKEIIKTFSIGETFTINTEGTNFNPSQFTVPQVNQPPAFQAPVLRTHGVSQNDFDNYCQGLMMLFWEYAKQGQNLAKTKWPNLTDMLSKLFAQNPKELKVVEAKAVKSSIDEPPEVELKDLPPYLEYAFLEGDDKLPVIIAKDLKDEEKAALIKVLKSHKRAIAWKLSDIKGGLS
ncbi:hypothetical protein Tco_0086068 [Tanacetum coccineum]